MAQLDKKTKVSVQGLFQTVSNSLHLQKAYLPERKLLIISMNLNGSGIRDISRVLSISTNTVLSEIRKKAEQISEP
jgi:transposase-like protein